MTYFNILQVTYRKYNNWTIVSTFISYNIKLYQTYLVPSLMRPNKGWLTTKINTENVHLYRKLGLMWPIESAGDSSRQSHNNPLTAGVDLCIHHQWLFKWLGEHRSLYLTSLEHVLFQSSQMMLALEIPGMLMKYKSHRQTWGG